MIRSMLFIPGNSPNLLINSPYLMADAIIFDLEDAVSPAEKDSARILVKNILNSLSFGNTKIVIRINAIDSPYWTRDLDYMLPLKPYGILLPKVNTKEDITILDDYISKFEADITDNHRTKILALIETAKGVENAMQIASSERVCALFLGAEDLTADLHCVRTKDSNEIAYARSRIVSCARASSIDAIDTPFTDVNDDEGAIQDARYAKSLGFSGKAAISPRHVEGINLVFSPTKDEIIYAYEVIEAITLANEQGKGATSLRGKMIDAPIVSRAEQIIEMAQEIYPNKDFRSGKAVK